MYLINKLKNEHKNEKIVIYVDMDGVLASYDVGEKLDFKNKRPLTSNIKTVEELAKLENVELHILSVCRENFQVQDKNEWLDKYAPFFKLENRAILSKEKYLNQTAKELKCNYLKKIIKNKGNEEIALIDDDNEVLKFIHSQINNIILFQDSSLID